MNHFAIQNFDFSSSVAGLIIFQVIQGLQNVYTDVDIERKAVKGKHPFRIFYMRMSF